MTKNNPLIEDGIGGGLEQPSGGVQPSHNQADNLDVSFYDRATNLPIEPMTNPKWCIEPIAQMTIYKDGQKFAALTKLPTKQTIHTYKRTLLQRLLRKRPSTFIRPEFDFERAIQHIVKVNGMAATDKEPK